MDGSVRVRWRGRETRDFARRGGENGTIRLGAAISTLPPNEVHLFSWSRISSSRSASSFEACVRSDPLESTNDRPRCRNLFS